MSELPRRLLYCQPYWWHISQMRPTLTGIFNPKSDFAAFNNSTTNEGNHLSVRRLYCTKARRTVSPSSTTTAKQLAPMYTLEDASVDRELTVLRMLIKGQYITLRITNRHRNKRRDRLCRKVDYFE
jgi:hypothetical protein